MTKVLLKRTYKSGGRYYPPGREVTVDAKEAAFLVAKDAAVLVAEGDESKGLGLRLASGDEIKAGAKVCLVLCPTDDMAADLAAFQAMCADMKLEGEIMAVNDAIKACEAPIAHAASLDAGTLYLRLNKRKAAGLNIDMPMHSVRDNKTVTHAWLLAGGADQGGSALFGALVARELGYPLVLTNAEVGKGFEKDREAWTTAKEAGLLDNVLAFEGPKDKSWAAGCLGLATPEAVEKLT